MKVLPLYSTRKLSIEEVPVPEEAYLYSGNKNGALFLFGSKDEARRASDYTRVVEGVSEVPTATYILENGKQDDVLPGLAKVIHDCAPLVVFCCSELAMEAMVGYSYNMNSVAGGYQFLSDGTPVYFLPDSVSIVNPFIRRQMEGMVRSIILNQRVEPAHWGSECHVVETVEESYAACVSIRGMGGKVTFDLETYGTMHDADFTLLSMAACADARVVYVWGESLLRDPEVRRHVGDMLSQPTTVITGSNLKYDTLSFRVAWGLDCSKRTVDVRLLRKMLDTESSGRLDIMAEQVGMGGHKLENKRAMDKASRQVTKVITDYKDLQEQGQPIPPPTNRLEEAAQAVLLRDRDKMAYLFALVPEEILHVYNARDVLATYLLGEKLTADMKQKDNEPLRNTYKRLVMPASRSLEMVEYWGFATDVPFIRSYSDLLTSLAKAEEDILYGYYGAFNLGSAKQVAEFLYEKCRLTPVKVTKKGANSSDEESLQALRGEHPAVEHLLKWRNYNKQNSSFAAGLLPHVRPDGRVHVSYLLDGARCMPAGELVLTNRGYIPVEDVRAGDAVITHLGRVRQVLQTYTNPPAQILKVTLQNGLSLRTTAAHEYLIEGKGWVRADALTVGDTAFTHSEPETWKDIPEWDGNQVSSWGRFRRSTEHKPRKLYRKYADPNQGHLKVRLARYGAQKRGPDSKDFTAHRTVLSAFVGPAPEGCSEGRHLNGIPWDNTISNLAWGSPSDNRQDARQHGTMLQSTGVKLTIEQVKEILSIPKVRSKHARGSDTDAAIALRYGVTRETIRDIRNGKRRVDLRDPSTLEVKSKFGTSAIVSIEIQGEEVNYGLAVDEDNSHVTGGIVTHNSGRLSCSSPNAQQWPRPEDDLSRMARDCFVAPPGRTLIALDYSMLELRIAAQLSGDTAMAEIFRRGEDLHLATAKLIAKAAWGIAPEAVTKVHRSAAKTVNFALLYGAGDGKIAITLGVDRNEAYLIRQAVLGAYKHLARWIREQENFARKHGYSRTWWAGEEARRRQLWNIASSDGYIQSKAKNGSFNSPVQGTGADFCLASLDKLVEVILKENLPAKVVATVHDSIILEADTDRAMEIAARAKGIMEGWPAAYHPEVQVPIVVDVEAGPRWGSLKKVDIG